MNGDLRLFLTLTCGVCWTIVYILIIIRSMRDRTYGMPFLALAFNICWELIFSAVLVREPHSVQLVINRVWGALDGIILVLYFVYGRQEWPRKLSKWLFYSYSIFVLAGSYFFVYLFSVEMGDPGGKYIAFIQNLIMSLLFINMLNNRKDRAGQSTGIAFFKMAGTLAAAILYGMRSPFILFLGSTIFIVDLVYLVMIIARCRETREQYLVVAALKP